MQQLVGKGQRAAPAATARCCLLCSGDPCRCHPAALLGKRAADVPIPIERPPVASRPEVGSSCGCPAQLQPPALLLPHLRAAPVLRRGAPGRASGLAGDRRSSSGRPYSVVWCGVVCRVCVCCVMCLCVFCVLVRTCMCVFVRTCVDTCGRLCSNLRRPSGDAHRCASSAITFSPGTSACVYEHTHSLPRLHLLSHHFSALCFRFSVQRSPCPALCAS